MFEWATNAIPFVEENNDGINVTKIGKLKKKSKCTKNRKRYLLENLYDQVCGMDGDSSYFKVFPSKNENKVFCECNFSSIKLYICVPTSWKNNQILTMLVVPILENLYD